MTRQKIYSRGYERLMRKPWDKRHTERNQRRYGVWRWMGMYEHRQTIVPMLLRARHIVDFGGAMGPLGFGAAMIDVVDVSITGDPVIKIKEVDKGSFVMTEWTRSLMSEARRIDVVFSSHTLEHVSDLGHWLYNLDSLLRSRGRMILHLPSDRNAGHWHPAVKPEHKRLFTLEERSDPAYCRIDRVMESMYYQIDMAEYCGDASIMFIARKSHAHQGR